MSKLQSEISGENLADLDDNEFNDVDGIDNGEYGSGDDEDDGENEAAYQALQSGRDRVVQRF